MKRNKPEPQPIAESDVVNALARLVLRDRVIMRALIVSLVLDVSLTFFAIFGTVYLHDVTQASVKATCISGNRARADNRYLWQHVISIEEKRHHVSHPSAALVQFEKIVAAATHPRDCSKPLSETPKGIN